jgi:3'-phosphoadenosine 5'-phosphosulfate sulfotransferase (PAPS reductase)/FAD synthetase
MIVNHLGVSGGKDSTALLLWAVCESGYPLETLNVTFCDTGNEHEYTYEHIRLLSERVHPIEVIKPPLDFYQLANKKKRFPSPTRRFCTSELKIKPTRVHIQKLLGQGYDVLLHSGVRAEESKERAELPERKWDEFFDCEVYRPLLRWTIDDVWAIHRRYGIPRNKLYDLGAKRVGCLPCIMSRKAEIRMIARRFPERIAMIREAENRVPSKYGLSTFFSIGKIPAIHCTRQVTTSDGRIVKVPTIDDVVAWSCTKDRTRKNLQYMLDFDDDRELSADIGLCPSSFGACE